MNVGMDELERLIGRYVSTGAAVVVVILGPTGQAAAPAAPASTGTPATATAQPAPATIRPAPATVTAAPGPTTVTVQPESPATATATLTATITPTATPTRDAPSPTTRSTRERTSGSATATDPYPSASPAPATTDRATTDGATPSATGTGPSAAEARGWGAPTREDDFTGGSAGWTLYDGPGHDGKGRRSPGAVTVRNGVLTITGDAAGTTGGLSWGSGRRYGRWESRVRVPAMDASYDAVLLLWPDAGNWPEGGEIDFMELRDPARRTVDGTVHHGRDNQQVQRSVTTDAGQWHNWAVEWTPTSIAMFLDGREWFRTADAAVQPPGPMHLCVQLDWFPKGGTPAQSGLQVDWVREYAAPPETGG